MGICCSNDSLASKNVPATNGPAGPVVKLDAKDKKALKMAGELTKLRATILIQKWFRMWLSKLSVRRELAWRIFKKTEYYGDRNQMKLNRFFRVLVENEFSTPEMPKKHSGKKMADETSELLNIPRDVEMNISPPFTIEKLNALIIFLTKSKRLHYTCVINLLLMTMEKMKHRCNFNEVSTSITNKVTIVGDLYGNLHDLLTIFYKNGIPSLDNPYIFNGNFVDRGPKSIEITSLLCYSFLLFPNHIYLNRGNHEDVNMGMKYGLMKEIMTKYRNSEKKIFNLFKDFFRFLPIGTIIDHKVLVIHGGISNVVDMNILVGLQRNVFYSVLKPEQIIVQNHPKEWEQIMDILWSDPVPDDGCVENEVRGGGKCFGPDVTDRFLCGNNFELLIRSHECKQDGYEYTHSRKVLTIFSTSNYYHAGSNKGAYVVYKGGIKALAFVQFVSNEQTLKNVKFKENVLSMEEQAINDLKRMVCTHRKQLLEIFTEKDVKHIGKLSIAEYGSILNDVLGINLPWRLIVPKICELDRNNLVIYEASFIHNKEVEQDSASAILYSNMEVLETIFRAIDKDNSGVITMAEFTNAMTFLQKHSDIDINEIKELGELIDIDKDGVIDINEFFEAFKISRN